MPGVKLSSYPNLIPIDQKIIVPACPFAVVPIVYPSRSFTEYKNKARVVKRDIILDIARATLTLLVPLTAPMLL